jgi:hypothetical protein
MGASFVQVCKRRQSRHVVVATAERGLSREQSWQWRVLQCLGEGEANGGGDGMAGVRGTNRGRIGPGVARYSAQ